MPDISFKYKQAAQHVKNGGILAYPTEAVWGLGCNPWSESSVNQLLALKKRPMSKGLILVTSSLKTLSPFINWQANINWDRVMNTWPGPNTWVVPASQYAPYWITGGRDSIAVRLSAHPTIKQLTEHLKLPITSTSANLTGKEPSRSKLRVHRWFGNDPSIRILDGELGGLENPTPIRLATTGEAIRI